MATTATQADGGANFLNQLECILIDVDRGALTLHLTIANPHPFDEALRWVCSVIFRWTDVVQNSTCELSVPGNQWASIDVGSSLVATAGSFAQQLSTVNTMRSQRRPAEVHGRTPIRLTSSTGTSRVAPPALAPKGWGYYRDAWRRQRDRAHRRARLRR